jgi:predicted dehydrogenase
MSVKKIRVGVLSAGAWSVATHIPELLKHEDVELVIVTNQDAARAKQIGEIFGFEHVSNSWESALEAGLDAVIVSSPPIAHESMVTSALNSGAHVLCEKPFALNGAAASRMVKTARDSQMRLLVGFGWPYTGMFQRTANLLAQNIVGDLEYVSLGITSSIRDLLLGQSTLDWSTRGILSENATYDDPKVSGGGAITTTLSHAVGLLIHLSRDSFDWIFGSSFPQDSALDFHESISGRLKSGASVNMSCASTFGSSPSVTWNLQFFGSKGELQINTLRGEIQFYGSGTESRLENFDDLDRGYTPGKPTSLLLECARGKEIPAGCDGTLGELTVHTTDALYLSFMSGNRNFVA